MRQPLFKYNLIFISLMCLSIFGCNQQKVSSPLLPIDTFLQKPDKIKAYISPSGENIILANHDENSPILSIFDQNSGDIKEVINHKKGKIGHLYWLNANKLIYQYSNDNKLFSELRSFDLKDQLDKKIFSYQNKTIKIVDVLKNSPDQILITLDKRIPNIYDVYRYDLEKEQLKLVEKNPGKVFWWITDNNGDVRFAIASNGASKILLYKGEEKNSFEALEVTDFKEMFKPLSFDSTNQSVFALSNIGRDKIAMVKYDPVLGEEIDVIYENPEVDLNNALFSSSGELYGLSFNSFKKEYKFTNPKIEKIYSEICDQTSGYQIEIIDFDTAGNNFIIKSFSEKTYGSLYFYSANNSKLIKIKDLSAWLPEKYLAQTKPIRYKTNDNITIKGFLTIPPGLEPSNIPVVVYPHAGPWHRTYMEFDPLTQFLANRGYGVLQINFRGSIGYGRDFYEAGFKEWGGAIQQDITEGTNWLIRQGIADSNLLAIGGYSFGGFLAMNGIIQNPKLYKCGVNYSGILNLFEYLESPNISWDSYRKVMFEMVGNPKIDSSILSTTSPILNCKKITSPLLLIYGENDPYVSPKTIESFVKCLIKNKTAVEYIIKDDEGHKFSSYKNRKEIYITLESFLAKYLKGRKSSMIE